VCARWKRTPPHGLPPFAGFFDSARAGVRPRTGPRGACPGSDPAGRERRRETVGEALRELPIRDLLFDESGVVRPLVNVYVDGVDDRDRGGLQARAEAATEVRVVVVVVAAVAVAVG
jgi:hypothetical protein